MSFIELNRYFVPIEKDKDQSVEIGHFWGQKAAGWLDWSELQDYRRVILLAEASSGKTSEFRNQTDMLISDGRSAFFTRIEELYDHGFEAALELNSADLFHQWRKGTDVGWFFLDSVDEARLNRKSFEGALKRFAKELGQSIDRARVFISCRVSDWQGREDRDMIAKLIPAVQPTPKEKDEKTDPLLDPILKSKIQKVQNPWEKPERKTTDLLAVYLAPLLLEQYRSIASAFGVDNVNEFVRAISQNGLDVFTERPGDLIDLIEYWKTYGKFSSFREMVEHNIQRKLKELSAYRPDNEILSLQEARKGVERLAAVLTLTKSYAIKVPGQNVDPTLAIGAVESAEILDNWTYAKRNALLRRGIFSPAT